MIYDEFAERVVAQYDMFLMALEGRYRAIVGPGVQITPAALSDFTNQSIRLGCVFLDLAEREAKSYAAETWAEQEEVYGGNAMFDLMMGLRSAVDENITQLDKALRNGAKDYKSVIKNAHGSIGLLLQKKMGAVEFSIYDTSNRKWEARRLVKVVVRDFAYQMWIDATIAEIKKTSNFAQVRYDDSSKAEREIILSLGEKLGVYKTIGSVRHQIFHINSTAKLVPYVQTK